MNMRSFIVAIFLLFASAASAAAPSMLCKATDVEEYYSVVAPEKGKVLFQVNSGTFLEGVGESLGDRIIAITINATNGDIHMVVDMNTDRGLIRIQYKDGRVYQHPIICAYK
jgi:hypothetical protein